MDPDSVGTVGRVQHGSSDDPSVLDFSANVNPSRPSGVETVYREAFERCARYPSEPPEHYRDRAAEYVDSSPAEVIPTPGGLAAIRLTIATTVTPGDTVLVPSPSFGEFAREVTLQGGKPEFVQAPDLIDCDPTDHALAIACQPNNPTGIAYNRDDLRRFADRCRAVGTPLLIDEAFLGFTDIQSLAGTQGTVVARSLTKLFGLPGLRAGFAVATDELRERLLAARSPWNVGVPALEVGRWCMGQSTFINETRERVQDERRRMQRTLADRFDVRESVSPFLLLDMGTISVDAVLDHLADQGIVVRDGRTFDNLDNHIRIAVRVPAENDRLLEALDGV